MSVLTVALAKRVTGLRRPFPIYVSALLGIVCLGFVASIVFSRLYWGYFFRRPPVLSELEDVTEVISIVPVTTEQTPGDGNRFVVDLDYSIDRHIAYAREDPYYSLDERILVYLEDEYLLPAEAAASLSDTDLYDRLLETGLLAESKEGYTSAGLLEGVVVQARTPSGSELVFLSATGRQVSNDHYPCYEVVFTRDSGSEHLAYVRGQRFFYDVAGMEGAEWYVAWITLSRMGLALAFPMVTLAVGVRNAVLTRKTIVQDKLGA